MSCELQSSSSGGVRGVLTLRREELLFDIANNCYVEGSVMTGEESGQRHTVQDVIEGENGEIVSRELDLNVARCREMLYAYTKRPVEEATQDNVLKEPGLYGIVMDLPEDFSQTTFNLIGRLVHRYLVCRCVAEWMSESCPEKYDKWRMKWEEAESEIERNLNVRRGKVRRRMHPF